MSKKPSAPDLKNRIKELEKGIEELYVERGKLQEDREKLQKENFRLVSLFNLWKASALRYQSIAAALAQAYNNVYPTRDRFENAVRISHSQEDFQGATK